MESIKSKDLKDPKDLEDLEDDEMNDKREEILKALQQDSCGNNLDGGG